MKYALFLLHRRLWVRIGITSQHYGAMTECLSLPPRFTSRKVSPRWSTMTTARPTNASGARSRSISRGASSEWTGLSVPEAIRVCRAAVSKDRNHPVLWLNLGRVYRAAGKTAQALEALDRAATIAPDNGALARELAELDRRGAPVLRSLPRAHPLNVLLGKALHSVRRARRETRAATAART